MSPFWGMDPGLARGQAGRLRTASGEIEALRGRLDAAVAATTWTGDDAHAFRDRWATLAAQRLTIVVGELAALGDRLEGEADQQDVTSDGGGSGPGERASTIPDAPTGDTDPGYRLADNPWLPNLLEAPLEGATSHLASLTSDAIGWGFDSGVDLFEAGLEGLGLRDEGFAQFQEDANHFGGILEGWATGERVPTIAEFGAAALVTGGSAGAGMYEAVTGQDTAFFDDRPGGIVVEMETDSAPGPAPGDLGDLLIRNDALRMNSPGGPLESGRIGVEQVRRADGTHAYIVQVPPTEGASPLAVPEAYGEQGNSRDWASNLRLVAGQHPAASDDVRAAMAAAGVPPGAEVLMVGHSQGGIVASHLAADPSFNSDSGVPGTYDVTHTFSVGSPVQTVVPSQEATQVVNVTHGPEGLDPRLVAVGTTVPVPGSGPITAPLASDIGYTGDPIAQSDLQGAQLGGGTLEAPNVHEVVLPGSPGRLSEGLTPLYDNHDSYSANDPDHGYYPSVQQSTDTDPVLSALNGDLTGAYLGEDVDVVSATVVTVGRGEP